jgi:hypothetical protein
MKATIWSSMTKAIAPITHAKALLNAQPSRKYGLHDLPPSTERIGTAIVVMRE